MARRLQIYDENNNLNANIIYEGAEADTDTKRIAKNDQGVQVFNRSIFDGKILTEGDTTKAWVDDEGNQYEENQLTFWIGDMQVGKVEMTKIFNIEQYDPLETYLDHVVIEKFYAVCPSDNGIKNEKKNLNARLTAINNNTFQMRRIWEHLKKNKVVARANFNTSSLGYIDKTGFLRAVEIDNKWGLEIGIAKTCKELHLFDEIPVETKLAVKEIQTIKRISPIKLIK